MFSIIDKIRELEYQAWALQDRLSAKHDVNWNEADHPRAPDGKFGSGTGRVAVADLPKAFKNIKRDPKVTAPDAPEKIQNFATSIPKALLRESSVKRITAYDNPEDLENGLQRFFDRHKINEDARGARGAYDRDSGTLFTSLWDSDSQSENGRNFYHEFSHTLEDRIRSDDWEHAFPEWSEHGQDEGFAEAFSNYMVAKNEGDTADFEHNYPLTYKMFRTWEEEI